ALLKCHQLHCPDGRRLSLAGYGVCLVRFDGVRTVSWQSLPGQHLPSAGFSATSVRATVLYGSAPLKDLQVGRLGSSLNIPRLTDRRFVQGYLRITKAWYGSAGWGFRHLESSARFRMAASDPNRRLSIFYGDARYCRELQTRIRSVRTCK